MALQKALFIPQKYAPFVVGDAPIPQPGPSDVLVKIISTALNPADWKIQAYDSWIDKYPFITGTDGAGIVQEVGSEVVTLVKGDRILFQGWFANDKSTFQQYTLVPAEITAKIPDNISFDEAASVPLGLSTVFAGFWNHDEAAQSLNYPAPWEEGGDTKFADKPIFILGGASSVGQYVIQFAKYANFSPIITTASPHNEDFLISIGATHVIDRSLSPAAVLLELPKLTDGRPIEVVYDAVGVADTQALAYDALAPGGALLLVLPDEIPAEKKKPEDGKKIVYTYGNVHAPMNRKIGVEVYSRLTEWLRTRVIVPNRVEVLPDGLAGIPAGLERLKENKVSGKKLIARPQETP